MPALWRGTSLSVRRKRAELGERRSPSGGGLCTRNPTRLGACPVALVPFK